MNTYRVGFWTGPTITAAIADKLRANGFVGVDAGTERVYFNSSGSDPNAAAWNAQVDLDRIGLTWTRVSCFREREVHP